MAEETSGAGGAVWALATILIVLIVVAALYFGGVFSQKKSIDININKPGVILLTGDFNEPKHNTSFSGFLS